MRKFRIKLDPVNEPLLQLPHPGLGQHGYKENLDLNRDWDDEEKRTKGGDISPKEFSTHPFVQVRYIPDENIAISEFEEKDIMAIQRNDLSVLQKETPIEVFGIKCPECMDVKVDVINGCACVTPIFDKFVVKSIEPKIEPKKVILVVDESDSRLKNPNRNTTTKPNIGKGGFTKESSPHKTEKGWKMPAPVAQKVFGVGCTESRISDSEIQKKISEKGVKVRKNTIAKIQALETRKRNRLEVGRIKGKV